ncbi:MobA-like NTP transferase protein [Litorimonas taeanensis]|uniref:MobA-like NTP transferase protein n=1 Tax=Litorimonas taeanensis TaxID=568099 RepID=A0A420WKH2_9PROT|nr:NTP transferase domain-containing protein [Litorimonas taeanensis]RKQ71551.1 MobA-like NTP transferase protein [Litorimonas taeanensis]
MNNSPQVLVLAGQRAGVADPLCEAFNVTYKVETQLIGKPMIKWVAEALDAAELKRPFIVSGYPALSEGWSIAASGDGPADSALLALKDASFPCLMTTGDHPLLTADILRFFIEASQKTGADFCVGLADEQTIQSAYPETKRTYLRFSDTAVSGCNLFYIANSQGLAALEFWREAQHLRKKPLQLARKVGIGLGIRYAAGRLSISQAFDEAGKKIGIKASPVLLPYAEAAIDVDKVSDHDVVEKILLSRFNS